MNRPQSVQRNKVMLFIVLLLLVSLIVTMALGMAWFNELLKMPVMGRL
jgi:hypothetical protein